jgi:hypothetical protein
LRCPPFYGESKADTGERSEPRSRSVAKKQSLLPEPRMLLGRRPLSGRIQWMSTLGYTRADPSGFAGLSAGNLPGFGAMPAPRRATEGGTDAKRRPARFVLAIAVSFAMGALATHFASKNAGDASSGLGLGAAASAEDAGVARTGDAAAPEPRILLDPSRVELLPDASLRLELPASFDAGTPRDERRLAPR